MNWLLHPILPLFVPLVSGYITNAVMNGIDDVLKLTANWSSSAKQAAVLALATVITTANQHFSLSLPADLAAYLQPATWQPLVAAGLAFVIKHGQQRQKASARASPSK